MHVGDRREMDKAPDAFRTISEVADDLELPQHVLRFWETRFSQIKPVKRAGGRRFYRPEDVDLLRGIRHLLYSDGYTIKGVQKILKEHGIRHVQDLGVERDTALLMTGKQQRALSMALEEGTTFGGLLGLFPRRRGRAQDDEAFALPQEVELPLPFPDPELRQEEADGEGQVPPVPLRRDALRREPSLHGAPRSEAIRHAERPSPEGDQRREPRMTAAPAPRGRAAQDEPVRRHPADDPPREHPMAPPRMAPQVAPPPAAETRTRRPEPEHGQAEDYAAAPPHRGPAPHAERAAAPDRPDRPVTLPRPTRGPAARIAPPSESFDDPLLPFLDPEPLGGPSVSEALEDRIRRLKRGRAPQPEVVEDDVFEEEAFETRELEAEEREAQLPFRDAPSRPRGAQQHSSVAEEDEDALPWDGTSWDTSSRDEVPWEADEGPAGGRHMPPEPPVTPSREQSPAPRRAPDEGATYGLAPASRPEPAPRQSRPTADRGPAVTALGAPAPAPRVGPLRAPLEEFDPEDVEFPVPHWPNETPGPDRPPAEALRAGARTSGAAPASRAVAARTPAPWQQAARDNNAGRVASAWQEDEAVDLPDDAGRGVAHMPRAPYRPGPPEQYLPPHLRAEPRLAGQPPVAAPVLSRDDLHRLRAALYELSECRRLMSDALPGAPGEAAPPG